MHETVELAGALVLGGAGAVLWSLALLVASRAARPGRSAFVLATGLLGAAALIGAAGVVAGVRADDPLWHLAVRTPVYLAVGAWFVFVVQFTGRSVMLSGSRTVGLMSPIAAFVVLSTLGIGFTEPHTESNAFVPALSGGADVVDGLSITLLVLGLFVYALAFAGVMILLQTSFVTDRLSVALVTVLSLAVLGPSILSFLGWAIRDVASPAATAFTYATGFAICGVACVAALGRYEAFDSSAVAVGTLARQRILSELEDAVIVVDDRVTVVGLNDAAKRTFDVESEDVIGESVACIFGEQFDTLQADEVVTLETAQGTRQFDYRATGLVDVAGGSESRWLGTVLSFRDVTVREMREQRIRILNRILRHNLRNKLAVVNGNAERVANADQPQAIADEIQAVSDELLALGEKARAIESVLDSQRANADPTCVPTVVTSVVDDARAGHDDLEIDVTVADQWDVEASGRALEYVVGELVDNAIAHNDADVPRLEVTVAVDDDTLGSVSVADNGPGIPDDECVAIRTGEESPIVHGSGLGLWCVRWVATLLGGEIQFEANDPRGSIVRVELPRAGAPGPTPKPDVDPPHVDLELLRQADV